jgi:aspartyl-tRNA(Asn)/glutamyl-tRNA(Gln) amidotransferase subunit C
MSANKDIDISYVAQLARLELGEDEKAHFQSELESVLEYIDLLTEVDVTGIEPTAHAVPLTNVTREDVSSQSGLRDRLLANAPATVDDELIRVPQVLPGEESS